MPFFLIIFIICLLLALTDKKQPFACFLFVLLSPVLALMLLFIFAVLVSKGCR